MRLSPSLLLLGLLTACAPAEESSPSGGPAVDAAPPPVVDAAPPTVVDAAPPPACGACHGAPDDPTPPPDLEGRVDPTTPGVGAHAAHMRPAAWRGAVKCAHCHVVPETVDDPGHIDAARPADVVFSGLARAGGAPEMQGRRCDVYCHGGFMRIRPSASPPWTTPGALDCGGCHGMPPPVPHPQDEGCGRCHLEVADLEGEIIDARKHIDSILQAPKEAHSPHLGGDGGDDLACDACHDGENYHGPLKDGQPLATTTICDECHGEGPDQEAPTSPQAWRDYKAFAP
ncbi:CxxxxCH/CxxCH domain-containing protein [Myxococcota bacterium]|nr:CxxxxCH/CxxCH domain-containing protein [Myxococcota bacterium]MBU1430152.1 CxxxxCH/CxxCH domain-containing protein [Myxococcota bacterium]MBU1899407.1 CxxxxCH/CxxCH domain-containing protein [Myxococcota bacterium]